MRGSCIRADTGRRPRGDHIKSGQKAGANKKIPTDLKQLADITKSNAIRKADAFTDDPNQAAGADPLTDRTGQPGTLNAPAGKRTVAENQQRIQYTVQRIDNDCHVKGRTHILHSPENAKGGYG